MNSYIYLDNFRGFSEAIVPITQVNFLVGENSTGKTSLLELLETFSKMPFWLFEPRFGVPGSQQRHFLDLVSAFSKNKKTFSIGAVELSEDASDNFGIIVSYVNMDGRPVPSRVSIVQGHSIRTVHGKLWRSKKGEPYLFRSKAFKKNKSSSMARMQTLAALHKSPVGFESKALTEEHQGAPLFIRFEDQLFDLKEGDRPVRAPYPFMTSFVELAPIRTKPRRTYDAPQTDFSPEGEHVPYVIKKRLASKSQAEAFQRFLEEAGRSSGLFKSIKLRQYGNGPLAPFEMKVVLGPTALGLDNVGYGVSQALPVLVEMFVRPRRATFAIQQPEVHLHPKAQATFGDVIAELARAEEKCFFVETHSDFTIDRFRLNLRTNGKIPAQLLFFERTEGGNKVTSISINDSGELDGNQPDSYREFFFNESLALLS